MAKRFESWRLFWLLALTVSVAICLGLPFADFHTWSGTEFIILHAVFCALPFFLVAFTASSLATLWPSRRARWLLSNRRYFGLAFALGMAWHLSFVTYATIAFGNRVSPRDLTLDFIAVSLLLAMSLTSFRYFARRLSLSNWRRLHKTGVYTICFVVTFFYLDDIRTRWNSLYLGMACLLLAAWVLRIVASTRVRRRARQAEIEMPAPRPAS
jgi:DMSO/TMAO reductase YedYZ heme-binding membrane subunit